MSKTKAYLCALSGAAAWGLIGVFVAPLYAWGFTAWDVVAIRVILSFVFLFLLMFLFFRPQLRTQFRDHLFFAGAGILSMVFFNFFYFEVFAQSSLSLAVTLLYTGPLFVTVLSRLFLKEPFYVTENDRVGIGGFWLRFRRWAFAVLGSASVASSVRYGDFARLLFRPLQHFRQGAHPSIFRVYNFDVYFSILKK
ncbi:EamA family transporter [Salicibibacter cibarius]|uniref:EamA family transporter n=1 Tax=Salicibibacter cibarius TaxID=2743000 RepID=UPI001FE396C9|nr:EamA family transporter [Salicibibacter cibarius]